MAGPLHARGEGYLPEWRLGVVEASSLPLPIVIIILWLHRVGGGVREQGGMGHGRQAPLPSSASPGSNGASSSPHG